jgi:integrase
LGEYIRQKGAEPKERIFSISYLAARMVVKKAGELVGISLRPHHLRRHAATYASRAGTPIEIVSKVILRHANLAPLSVILGRSLTWRQ